jgi:isoleucyl-tRNA synthetase
MKKYPEYRQLNLSQVGKDILKFWEENQTFEKSVSTREGATPFVFYEGPPSANGMPGIHHVMARAVKDIFCRYKTQKGYQVKRKAGWDTHGLPIELAVEKSLGITKEDIGNKNSPRYISVEDYNKACRKEVMKYTDKWEEVTRKMGYWVDMGNPYITYDNQYIESVWWLLKNLHEKNLLYKGYTIQPYSPAAGTGLSTHELNQPGCYRNVKDRTATVMFKVLKDEKIAGQKVFEETYFLAWTTTPWTLPSNTALAVGKNIDYVVVKTFNPHSAKLVHVVLAKDLAGKYFPEKNAELKIEDYKAGDKNIPFQFIKEVKGADLEGLRYEQLLQFAKPSDGDAFRVVTGDFVTTEDGTGIVHIAPSFGADDFKVAKQNGIGSLTLVDKRGRFLPEVQDGVFLYGDEYVKEAYLTDDEKKAEFEKQKKTLEAAGKIKDLKVYLSVDERIVLKLQEEGRLFKKESYEHSYPHCWRTDKPVLYYPLDSWFIKTTASKERMIELNNTINWKPESTGTGRFGNWLENLNDWNLSRSRFWGIPLPIWTSEDRSEQIVIGSAGELKKEIDNAVAKGFMKENPLAKYVAGDFSKTNYDTFDLHKPYADNIVLERNGKKLFREPDLIDVWFDSGAMPYAQLHYPFRLSATLSEGEGETAAWQTASKFSYGFLKEKMLELRKNNTQAESVLWEHLRGRKLEEYKFRRQHAIHDFIVDFICLEKRVIVEVDGGYHNDPEIQLADKEREKILRQIGYKIMRFTNNEVLGDIQGVVKRIRLELAQTPTIPKGLPPIGGTEGGFPADFIAEGVDQTRGWFFTLHAIATMCFDSVAYKNVVSNGLVLDKNGNKMSKRLGNAVDPFETLEKYGPDATRWYMITNAAPWDNLKFDIEGITEVQRKFFGTLYNTYSFFALYANVDGFTYSEKDIPVSERPEIDRWILSELNSLIKNVDEAYASYEPHRAGRAIEYFVDEHLSNWYVRLCRRRFWKGEYSADKVAAYQTLYRCLEVVAQLAAPIAPFFTDRLYSDLDGVTQKANAGSVHLSNFPQADEKLIDKSLEERMELAQKISSMILSIRKKENIRVRQPLNKIQVPVLDANFRKQVEAVKDLILAEVNVKEIEFVDESQTQIVKNLKLNFKTLGKKCGRHMKAVQVHAQKNEQALISAIEKTGRYEIKVDDEVIVLENEDVEIIPVDIPGWKVANSGPVTVALDITITEPLRQEGMARELVNRIQNIRKDKGFEVTDKINVQIAHHDKLDAAIKNNLTYICSETLTKSLNIVEKITDKQALAVEVDEDVSTVISVEKI